MIYLPRRLSRKLNKITHDFPVTILSGARQVGKSTLLQHEFADYAYLSLDDFSLQEKARRDPTSLWIAQERVILDEVQKFPALLEAVKLSVDSSGRRQHFILSGSANLLLMQGVTESLAGRAMYLDLFPLTFGEEQHSPENLNFQSLWEPDWQVPEEEMRSVDPLPYLLRGFFPPLLSFSDHEQVLTWLEGYTRTYLERDLTALSQVSSLIDFRQLMQAVALRTGMILNQADVSKDCGLSHATAHRYIRLLEASHLVARVPAFSRSRKKRIVKSPKIFFIDPALSIFLSGIHDAETLQKSRELGGYFETLVYLHLRAWCEAQTPKPGIYYWRTVSGQKVDFIIERGRKLLALEVKLTTRPAVHDIRNLLLFLQEYPETVRGVLVHAGSRLQWLHSRIVAVPWWWIDL
jgi:predicted AAA+ superfamily ATPase